MHTHIKLGAHAMLNVNHSYRVDFRSYAPVLILGVDTPALILEVMLQRCFESLCSNTLIGTTCILHSQVVVVSLHCRQY